MDRGGGRAWQPRGRAWQPRGRSSPMRWSPRPNTPFKHPHTQTPDLGDGLSGSNSWPDKDGRKSSQQKSGAGGSFLPHPGPHPASHYKKQMLPSYERQDGSPNVIQCHLEQNSPHALGTCLEERDHTVALESDFEKDIPSSSDHSVTRDSDGKMACGGGGIRNFGTMLSDVSNKLNISELQSETVPSEPGDLDEISESKNPSNTTSHKTEHSEQPVLVDPFDICPPKESGTVVLKPPLLVKNRERRNEIKRNMDTRKGIVLRPGMVLLKGYISLSDQVKIVKRCRDLGLGSGGFYQPGYREGTKLHLKMMCLGKNWDPQTSEYGDHRPSDAAKPPNIPVEFHQLIEKAMRDAHAFIQQDSKIRNPEKILPWMSSNVCIVNFYSQNGRLGLHQDKDESEESLRQGLPVVSFSIGDSADFLYGDERDVDKAQKVVLESGDVLIFGGRSRNVFHGVTAIHPKTTPQLLLEETNLRPGRLNLTFRQY